MGDTICALWIAQGARNAGVDSYVRAGGSQEISNNFGFTDSPDLQACYAFGGQSTAYKYELGLEERKPRVVSWQEIQFAQFEPARPTHTIPLESREWAADFVGSLRNSKPKGVCVVFPTTHWKLRDWPIAKYLKLVWDLHEDGWVVIGADHRRENVQDMPNYVYGTSQSHLMGLIEQATFVLGNDSGGAHLAGTMGKRTYAICGATDPLIVFGHDENVIPITTDRKVTPCVGCHFKYARGYINFCDRGCEAMMTLSYRTVYDIIKANESS